MSVISVIIAKVNGLWRSSKIFGLHMTHMVANCVSC